MSKTVSGFSKFSKEEKIKWLSENFFQDPIHAQVIIKQYWNDDEKLQQLFYN